MKPALLLAVAGVVLLTACAFSLWSGKTIGLYGVTETRASVFYWIILATYGGLGLLCLVFAFRTR